jgi:predicted DNA binding protein
MDPIEVKGVWAWYRILAFQQKDIKNLLEYLEKVGKLRIVSSRALNGTPARDTFVISSSNLLGDLTKKQALATLAALYQGYYDIPKRVPTAEIAKSLGLPRTIFEEHLRKAESKAMKAITSFLQLSGFRQPKSRITQNRISNGKQYPRLPLNTIY